MILARPKGRGNWTPIRIVVDGERAAPMLVRIGATFELGGIVWRVVEVLP